MSAVDLGLGHERRHRVHNNDIQGSASDEDVGDFQGLLAAVRLRDEQVVRFDAQLARVCGVEGVLGVDEGRFAAAALRRGNGVQGQGGLSGGFGSVDLDDAAAWQAADTQGNVQGQRAGGNDRNIHGLAFAEAHDGAFAELLFDLAESQAQDTSFLVLAIRRLFRHRFFLPFCAAMSEQPRVTRVPLYP